MATKSAIDIPPGPRMAKGLRALANHLEGRTLSPGEFGDAEYARKKLVDALGLEWARAVPIDRIGKFAGKQAPQLNVFVADGVPSLRKTPVDITAMVRECFDTIAANRKTMADQAAEIDRLGDAKTRLEIDLANALDDGLDDDDDEDATPSPPSALELAKVRRMEALAASGEVALREKAGELVRASDIEPLLTTVADRIRQAGDTIGQQYGPDAQRIITGALDEAERQLAELRRTLNTTEGASDDAQ